MRKFSAQKRSSGFVQIVPLLVVALVAFGILSLTSSNKKTTPNVLSESESGSGSSGSGSPTATGSSGSGEGTEIKSTATPKVTTTGVRKAETESKVENKDENEQEVEMPELEDENEFEVEEGTESARVKIGKKENKFFFLEQKFGAESEFPVSVNPTTKELTITTPAGTKTVAVLPDSAVENMLAGKVIDNLLAQNGRIVEIKVNPDGSLVYEISGTKSEKFLGLINVLIPKTAEVSTQTGQLISLNEAFITRILDALSF